MNISKKFLLGVLLLSSIAAQNLFAMESEPITSEKESAQIILQDLKIQLVLSVFIVMRVDLDYADESYWKEPLEYCSHCILFAVDGNNETDLYFTRRLLVHLNELSDPRAVQLNELSAQNGQVVAGMAYEMFCTLNSLWPPIKLNDIQKDLIDLLSLTYSLEESFDGLEIFKQDIELLLTMSKTLLLKLLDLKFLRAYPCNYKNKKERKFGQGYLKREKFCTHYIEMHCCYLERQTIYTILNWFRLQSQELSSEQVYDFVWDYFNGGSQAMSQKSEDTSSEYDDSSEQDSSTEEESDKQESQDSRQESQDTSSEYDDSSMQDTSTDEEFDFLSSYRLTRY